MRSRGIATRIMGSERRGRDGRRLRVRHRSGRGRDGRGGLIAGGVLTRLRVDVGWYIMGCWIRRGIRGDTGRGGGNGRRDGGVVGGRGRRPGAAVAAARRIALRY
jgi:hypothetical protein